MNLLKSLNKEQWAAVGAAGLSLLLVAGAMAGGSAPGTEIPSGGTPYDYEMSVIARLWTLSEAQTGIQWAI